MLAMKPKLGWQGRQIKQDRWWSKSRLDSSSYKEIFVQCGRHFEKPVRSQGEFVAACSFLPVLPPVAVHVLHLSLPVLVPGVGSGLAGTIAMESWKDGDRVIKIKFFNFMVELINFFLLVSVVVRLRTIIPEPAELRRVH